jgi:hypothetical protein
MLVGAVPLLAYSLAVSRLILGRGWDSPLIGSSQLLLWLGIALGPCALFLR